MFGMVMEWGLKNEGSFAIEASFGPHLFGESLNISMEQFMLMTTQRGVMMITPEKIMMTCDTAEKIMMTTPEKITEMTTMQAMTIQAELSGSKQI